MPPRSFTRKSTITASRTYLALLPSESGLVVSPLKESAAVASGPLDVRQRSIVIGDPVPIIFTRRITVDSVAVGGVFVSPGATEGRFENDSTSNDLTVDLHLVLSEGQLPALQLRDVFQGSCRVGTWKQTYDRRAGTFTAGNHITTVSGKEKWECPLYCGTSGNYDNMTTLAFQRVVPDGNQTWDRQIHCFVREGIQVTRILDDTLGPSNNIADLALYLIRQSSRLPEALLDTTAFTLAANFTNTNNFYYNGIFNQSTNLEEWLQKTAQGFLLRVSDKNGAKGLRPALPINTDFTIQTTAVSWDFDFTEEHILPDGFQIEYIPLADRKPITAQVLWRQQPDDDIGIIRTAQVRYTDEATDGPFEQYDLSEFCTSENHAIKVGMFYIARRKYITHTLRIKVKPDSYNTTLVLGDIVRVVLRRETEVETPSQHNYLYEVERINKTISGAVELDLIHFPVDTQGRSLVAIDVAAAEGQGTVLDTGRDDFGCDDSGRRTNTDELDDEGGNLPDIPSDSDFNYDRDEGDPGEPEGCSNDGDCNPPEPDPDKPTLDPPEPDHGDEMTVDGGCENPKTTWYRRYNNGPWQQITLAQTFTTRVGDTGWQLYAETCCPDPANPGGFAPCRDTDPTPPVNDPEEGGGTGVVHPDAVKYRVHWTLGFGQSMTVTPEAGGGILVNSDNKDGFCSGDSERLFIGYYNTSGTWVYQQFPSTAGCVEDALARTQVYAVFADDTEQLIFNKGTFE